MNETVTKVKTILTWVVAILIVTVLIVPYILILLYYRKQGKSIQLVPEFKIIDAKKETDEVLEEANQIIKKNEDILGKIK